MKLTSARIARMNKAAVPSHWADALGRMEGAYSRHTIVTYRKSFLIFEAWCEQHAKNAVSATPSTISKFLLERSQHEAAATVDVHRTAIGKIYRLLQRANPVDTEEVHLAMRTVYRKKGRRQRQARGLTNELKSKLLAVCPSDLTGLRDAALIATGYDSLCRSSELVDLRIEDFKVGRDRAGSVLIRRAKNDPFGEGRLAYLSPETVHRVRLWLNQSGLEEGPIFRKVLRGRPLPRAMNSMSVAFLLKRRAAVAKIAPSIISGLSGHSMRVGAAQDMAAAGIDIGGIMHAGGWKSPQMVMRYIEHLEVQRSGMAQLHRATHRRSRS